MPGPADKTLSAESLLQDLPREAATLARSVRARVLSQGAGALGERVAPRELAFLALRAGGAEVARLQLRPGAPPRLIFPAEAQRAPIEVASLQDAVAAADAVRAWAEQLSARVPQLDLFGGRK
jgi:hypothetical protein